MWWAIAGVVSFNINWHKQVRFDWGIITGHRSCRRINTASEALDQYWTHDCLSMPQKQNASIFLLTAYSWSGPQGVRERIPAGIRWKAGQVSWTNTTYFSSQNQFRVPNQLHGDVRELWEEFQNNDHLVAKCWTFSENTRWLQGKQWVLK